MTRRREGRADEQRRRDAKHAQRMVTRAGCSVGEVARAMRTDEEDVRRMLREAAR